MTMFLEDAAPDSCTDSDSGTDPQEPPCQDADADGFADMLCGGPDCDDGDARSNPGAIETCDNIDNDCNESTEDGVGEIWFGQGCDGDDSDACLEGTRTCIAGENICNDETDDTIEI